MKILDTPRSGKCGQTVAFQSRFGLCLRQHVPQKAGLTPARQHSCAIFGGNSRKWSAKLSDEQHDRWTLAGAQVMSHPRLAQKGPLTGQQFWQAISTVRAIVGLPETLEVPARPVFSQSKVGRLVSRERRGWGAALSGGFGGAERGHYGIRPGAVQPRPLQAPECLLPRPAAASDWRPERDYPPLQGQVWRTAPRPEDLHRHLPGKGWLEGTGSGDQRNCPGTAKGPSGYRRDSK